MMKLKIHLWLQFEANYTRSTVAPSLISSTLLPILNNTSTAISNQTAVINATAQNVTNSFTSASSEYFNRFILEIHESSGIDDLGKIKWEMASEWKIRRLTEFDSTQIDILLFLQLVFSSFT
jgi:Sodium:neurotransmitter symporter family